MFRTTDPFQVACALLCTLATVSHDHLSAQPCLTIEWERTVGGNDNDITRGAAILPDGRYVIAGGTISPASGEVSETGYGLFDAWAVCLEPDGAISWERRYGGSAGEQFEGVAVTNDGGLIFVGLTASPQSGLVSQPPYSGNLPDYWVVRTDAWGNVLWERRFGGSDIDVAKQVIARADGTFLVAGYSHSPVSGNKSALPRGIVDYWVVAIAADGTKMWDACYGGSGAEYPLGMTPHGSGGGVIVGDTSSPPSGDISGPARGPSDIWALAIDGMGTKLWERRYGGSAQDLPYGGVANIGSDLFIGAQTNSPASGDLVLPAVGIVDALGLWVSGADGSKQFETRAGGTFIDGCRSVAVLDPTTLSSNVAMAGQTLSGASGTITGIPRGNWDYWLTIQSVNNAVMGQFRCGSSGADELTQVLHTPDGGYLLVGMSEGDAGYDKSEDNRGVALDMWIVKVKPTFEVWWYADADGDGFGTPLTSVFACEPPVGYVRNDRDCDDTDDTRYTGAPCTDAMGDPGVLDASCSCATTPSTVTLPVVMGMEGPMDEFTGLMDDDLRDQELLPAVEPYTQLGFNVSENANFQADPAAFLITGTKAIVDWVLIELRDVNDPGSVLASRAGLLQRDGTLVMTDGASPFTMNAPPNDYYVAVRHRNHLGVMTTFPVAVNSQTQLVDLRDPQFPVFGTDARVLKGSVACLWAGDVNGDGVISYTGQSNDRDAILIEVGGTVPTATTSGYLPADLNMDGQVKYAGAGNDRDVLLQNIGGVVPTATRVSQLP